MTSVLALSMFGEIPAPAAADAHVLTGNVLQLRGPWTIQSPAIAGEHEATVPSTIFAQLVRTGVYRDPYYGMNLRSMPGVTYPIGENFSNLEMGADSPFRSSWWYRTSFDLPQTFRGKHMALHIDGVNYRANGWLNGHKFASAGELAGTWRAFEFDVTGAVRSGANMLELEVFAPTPADLALTFVDWNPMPPDKNMGLYRPVRLSASGAVTVRNVQVVSRIEMPDRKHAHLTMYAELRNVTHRAVSGVVRIRFEGREASRRVQLAAGERRTVTFAPQHAAALNIASPQLWWPAHMGAQPLYDLSVEFWDGSDLSDRADVRFGIREVTSEIDERGHRVFRVNGERMLVLGAGWTPDMMLRTSALREEDEIRYVRDMHLNTIRLEGKIMDDAFFDLCDRYGIMVMAGWCCCDRWEQWNRWNAENYRIAGESLRTQLRRLRNHPSLLTFAYGSDNAPPAKVERLYLRVLREERWPNPYQAAASDRTTLIGTTGVKMTGPYDYVAPSYWLDARAPGGASGFNSETSPGAAVPPVESLRRFIPENKLWPVNDTWYFHAGGGQFKRIDNFMRALEARYGKAASVDDFALKAQLMTYEGERAMFEAFRRNKYESTGVIQWMLNNAWPSLIWHLYDYYLRPGGGYFGTKKACEPLHAQYSYDDRSIVVTNELRRAFHGYTVYARVFDLDMRPLFGNSERVDIPPDSSTRVFVLPGIDSAPLYFAALSLADRNGAIVSSNLYWLSAQADQFDWNKSTWYDTPLTRQSDFAALQTLPKVHLGVTARASHEDDRSTIDVSLHNGSAHLAFFVRASVCKGMKGDEVLPVFWNDNYVAILPGTSAQLRATFRPGDMQGARPVVRITGWNVTSVTKSLDF